MPDPQNDNIIRFEKRNTPAQQHPPLINLPPATKILLGLIIISHLLLWGAQYYAPSFQTEWIYYDFGFVAAKWTGELAFTPKDILSLITVNFIHGGWFHVIINAVTLVAFGSGIEKRMGAEKMLTIFFSSSALALLTHLCVSPDSFEPVIGASGGISGMFGAVLVMLKHDGQLEANNQRILPIIIVWILISVVFGFMGGPDGSSIAWVAHIGGFLAGLGIAYLMLNKPKRI